MGDTDEDSIICDKGQQMHLNVQTLIVLRTQNNLVDRHVQYVYHACHPAFAGVDQKCGLVDTK